jgi:hypothetical protein
MYRTSAKDSKLNIGPETTKSELTAAVSQLPKTSAAAVGALAVGLSHSMYLPLVDIPQTKSDGVP